MLYEVPSSFNGTFDIICGYFNLRVSRWYTDDITVQYWTYIGVKMVCAMDCKDYHERKCTQDSVYTGGSRIQTALLVSGIRLIQIGRAGDEEVNLKVESTAVWRICLQNSVLNKSLIAQC